MSTLTGKVAVVTGGSKGIGASIARALAAAGAAVVVTYASDREGAERVVEQVGEAGGQGIAIRADVSKLVEIRALFETTTEAFGPLDVLVNNAGVYAFGPLEAVTELEFRRQFDTNVLGPLLVTQEALRHFGRGGGSVINIGSIASEAAPPQSVIYSASKSALDAVTRVLAKELAARNIRVNSINPGPVRTEGFQSAGFQDSDFEKQAVARTPLGRVGQPRDIAAVATFLASEDAAWLTGDVLLATGGLR